jgi:5'-methylthioadenosine phosphorylase
MDAEIGIIGGSGLYSLIDGAEEVYPDTKYGKPSGPIAVGELEGRRVAFLPRHGKKHTIPPHKVPYRANIEALAQLGVKRIIATVAVGSLRPDYAPGEIAVLDQFVDLTRGRNDTFFDEDTVAHVSAADPYCPDLRSVAISVARNSGMQIHETGSVVVINGPRFSSRAESRAYSSQGHHLINMTQYPEVILAREKSLCYVGIALVTDYDAGLEGREDIKPVTNEQVSRIFGENVAKAKTIIHGMVRSMPRERSCSCPSSLDGAILTQK